MLLTVLVWVLLSLYKTASFELLYILSSLQNLGILAASDTLIALLRGPHTNLGQKRGYRPQLIHDLLHAQLDGVGGVPHVMDHHVGEQTLALLV